MTGPDDNRGAPAGWTPASPAGWTRDPARPGSGPAWSAAATAPGPSYAGPAPRPKLGPAKLFGLAIAALGGLNFVFGFLPQVTASRIDESLSVYAVGPGYVPILLLIAGLLALAAFLPGSERSRLAVAAVSVGGAVGALISLGTTGSVEMLTSAQVSKGMGAVLLTIFGIIQAVVAIAAYLVGADFGARSGSAAAADMVRAPDRPVGATTWSGPVPAAMPAPGSVPPGSMPYYAGYAPVPDPTASGWAPPADDDRPTGPQQVVDPNAEGPASPARQAPAERELPRAAPVGLGKPPAPTAQEADDGSASGPTEVYRIPPRPPAPEEPGP